MLDFVMSTKFFWGTLLYVPERIGTGESVATSKNVSAIITIEFLISLCLKPWAVCMRKSFE